MWKIKKATCILLQFSANTLWVFLFCNESRNDDYMDSVTNRNDKTPPEHMAGKQQSMLHKTSNLQIWK